MAGTAKRKEGREIWMDRLLALLGVGLAVYFYFNPYQVRQLTYQVHPVTIPLTLEAQADSLCASYRGQPVAGNIYSAQIAFWNAGNESIRQNQVLNPLTIITGNQSPILTGRVLSGTREVINLRLDKSRIQDGRLAVQWDILEKDDGGVVQVVYAGKQEAPLQVQAVVEGQREITPLPRQGLPVSSLQRYVGRYVSGRLAGWFFMILGIIGVYVGVMGIIRMKTASKKEGPAENLLHMIAIFFNLLWFSMGLYMLLLLNGNSGVPFVF